MRLPVSGNARIALFAALAFGSLGLKAAAGPPRDRLIVASPGRFEHAVNDVLGPQHFATSVRIYRFRTPLVLASRGACRLAVRDATFGAALASTFAEDARDVGPVRYLYRGVGYERPPGLLLRWGRLKVEVLDRLGLGRPMPILTALAASPGCGGDTFGLSDLRLTA